MYSFQITAKTIEKYTVEKGIEAQVHYKLHPIKMEWDALLPESNCLRSHHLIPYENAKIAGLQPVYILFYKNDIAIACTYLQEFHFNSEHFTLPENLISIFLKPLKCLTNDISAQLVICGNLFRIQHSFYSSDESFSEKKLSIILKKYCDSRCKVKTFAGVFVKDLDFEVDFDLCPAFGFQKLKDDLVMNMKIDPKWNTLNDYTADLSKKYRKRLEKIRKQGAALERKWLTDSEIEEYKGRIFDLYNAIAQKQSIRIGLVNADYFGQLKQNYGDAFRMLAYFYEGKLVAYASMIFYDDHTYEIHYIGIDAEMNDSLSLYFNILYDGLEVGIIEKYTQLELGRTARVAKASLGAEAHLMHSYYKMKHGLPAIMMYLLQTFFGETQGENWKERNPFKLKTENTVA